MGKFLKAVFIRLKSALTHRIWLKLLSLLLALILWSYIINSTPSLTRSKKVEGLNVSISGASALSNNGLALLTDVFKEYGGTVDVTLDISQKEFYRATYESVSVFADVSGIRTPGTHEVRLSAVTNRGSVVSVDPSTIHVVVENLDSREVPVEVNLTGNMADNYWYSISDESINPQMITVSGPASLVLQVNAATAELDVTEQNSTFRRATLLNMEDSAGNAVNKRLLTRSSSTCSATVDIYPTKEIPLKANASEIKVTEGYEIVDISFQPPVVTVAADQKLLDSLDSLPVDIPSSDAPLNQTRTKRVNITRLTEIEYMSSRQTVMTVTVQEKNISKTIAAVPIEVYGLSAEYDATLSTRTVAVTVRGPYSIVDALTANDISVYVDASKLKAGTYDLPVYYGNKTNVTYDQVTPEYINLTLSLNHKNSAGIDSEG